MDRNRRREVEILPTNADYDSTWSFPPDDFFRPLIARPRQAI